MNWVLNPRARKLLLEVGPAVPFNLEQARSLQQSFRVLEGTALRASR